MCSVYHTVSRVEGRNCFELGHPIAEILQDIFSENEGHF